MLRGAGAAIALPFLESLLPRRALAGTAAAVRPPLRMGIFTVTGGTVLESWKPAEAGPLGKLPSILRPLEFAKDDLLVLSGLSHSGQSENLNGHEHCAFAHLTGAPVTRREGGRRIASISVDQAAAQVIGRESVLPSMEIGCAGQEAYYSFRAPDAPVPYEGNPRLVFERMFRGRKPVVPNWQKRAATAAAAHDAVQKALQAGSKPDCEDQCVIDNVLGQATDLRKRLGRSDRGRLDEYLQSVRSVEKRIALAEVRHRQELLDLASPGPSQLSIPTNLPLAGIPIWQISQPLDADPEKHAEYIRLMADMMILAFQTDTTRVVTLAAGTDDAKFPGVVTVGYERHCHTLEHQGNADRPENADPIAREACRQIHAWYTQLFAEMVRKMKSIDEGGSSLLDNCMLLYTSYMSNGGHGLDDYPVLFAGNAQGSFKTGRHVVYEKRAPVANLYVEMLDRLGIKVDKFGDSHTSSYAGSFNGRLPGLI